MVAIFQGSGDVSLGWDGAGEKDRFGVSIEAKTEKTWTDQRWATKEKKKFELLGRGSCQVLCVL